MSTVERLEPSSSRSSVFGVPRGAVSQSRPFRGSRLLARMDHMEHGYVLVFSSIFSPRETVDEPARDAAPAAGPPRPTARRRAASRERRHRPDRRIVCRCACGVRSVSVCAVACAVCRARLRRAVRDKRKSRRQILRTENEYGFRARGVPETRPARWPVSVREPRQRVVLLRNVNPSPFYIRR